jgi:dTDP-glucose 4,6-dehydratase
VDAVVNFAAETHVDRSILGPEEFVETNVAATFRLLDESLAYWRELPGARREAFRFLHVSTDEVYGHLEADDPAFTEETPYAPRSPYSASKASSDHLARSFFHTYDLPLVITNCSNNYGPRQFPEKLIPLCLLNALEGKPLPVYGRGENVRDWLFVDDHCEAILAVLHRGRPGRSYNVGGECEMTNIDLVRRLCRVLDAKLPDSPHTPHENLITFVADRPGHDLRYAMNISRIRDELGWTPGETFETGLAKTVDWYLDHGEWVESIRSGDYARWIEANYRGRGPRSDKDET